MISTDLTREEQGLPQHPVMGWLECPKCEGYKRGRHICSKCEKTDEACGHFCEMCDGDGDLWDSPVPQDALVEMAKHRRFRWFHGQAKQYDSQRARAMTPVRLPA